METNYYRKYEPIFNAWHIKRIIGEGSFGTVYEIERKEEELDIVYTAALKAITIPQHRGEIKSVMADGMSESDVTEYYRGIVHELVGEFILMEKLKGNSNIVSYEDHALIKHEDGIGWDILIRMELLTPLYDHISKTEMTKRDIIKLGIDLCKALELCQKYNIVHRDVKPENIFISPSGNFKLGDFGIAKTVEKTSSGMSKKGTYTYMAPEIYRGDAYGSTVDIYSLGVVMYRLLNHNRAPFMPLPPVPITYRDREDAFIKRISGVELPPPVNAEGRLQEIVLKACAFDVNQRYHSPKQMRMDLESILYDRNEDKIICFEGAQVPSGSVNEIKTQNSIKDESEDRTVSIFSVSNELSHNNEYEEQTMSIIGADDSVETLLDNEEEQLIEVKGKNSKVKDWLKTHKKIAITLAIVIIALIAGLVYAVIPKGIAEISGINDQESLKVGDTLAPEYAISPDRYSDEKILFESSNNGIATVDKDGKITAKDVGETTLTISALEYQRLINITVSASVTEISNVKKTITLTEGESVTLKPKLKPEKYSKLPITYEVSKKKIATVSKDGVVKAKKLGKTSLTISAGGYSKKITIVVKEYVAPTSATKKSTYSNGNNNNSSKKKSGKSTGKSKSSVTFSEDDFDF